MFPTKDASHRKAWLLHTIEEPKVTDNRTTICRNGKSHRGEQYGGKLVVDTLLPKNASINKVGGPGKECWNEITQENYLVDMGGPRATGDELGAWRIEVSPKELATEDLFLHVMTVMDTNVSAPQVKELTCSPFVGASVNGTIVLFHPEGDFSEHLTVDLPDNNADVLICGLATGTWFEDMGTTSRTIVIPNGAGCMFLEGVTGKIDLKLKERTIGDL